jgi:hypothetical protein
VLEILRAYYASLEGNAKAGAGPADHGRRAAPAQTP